MDTRIPQLPYIPGPVDPATSYIEVSVPDLSSDTGFTSCKAFVQDISSPPPSVGTDEIAFGDGSGQITSSPLFSVDAANGNLGIGSAPPTDTHLYVVGNTGSGEKLMTLYTNDGGWEVFKVRQGATDSRVNNFNFYPSGPVGFGGDAMANLYSEGGGNPRITWNTTQENLAITGSSIPVIGSARPELNINAPLVGFNLVGLAALGGVHVHGHGNTTGNAFYVDNSSDLKLFRILEDGYVVNSATDGALADARLGASEYTTYLNEATDEFIVKVKYADGVTVKTASILLI